MDLKKIISNDYETMKTGHLDPDFAYRLYIVFRVLYKNDSKKKVKKSIDNFYSQLKKHYPEIAEFLKSK